MVSPKALKKYFFTELQTPQHKGNLVNSLKKEIQSITVVVSGVAGFES